MTVSDVILPRWASSPEEFIRIHRMVCQFISTSRVNQVDNNEFFLSFPLGPRIGNCVVSIASMDRSYLWLQTKRYARNEKPFSCFSFFICLYLRVRTATVSSVISLVVVVVVVKGLRGEAHMVSILGLSPLETLKSLNISRETSPRRDARQIYPPSLSRLVPLYFSASDRIFGAWSIRKRASLRSPSLSK